MPETTEIIRFVEHDPSAINVYKRLVKDSFAKLKNSEITTTNVLTKLLRLSHLTGGFLSDDECKTIHQISKSKLQALEDIPNWLAGLVNVFEKNTVGIRKATK